MKLLIGAANIKPVAGYPVVAIGNFDGVHLGHQAILSTAVRRAREHRGTSVVLTFEPHPKRVFHPEKTFKLLTTFQVKMRLIEGIGIDLAYVAEFNKKFSERSPEVFAKAFLKDQIGAKEVIVGQNFRFGQDRAGTVADLIRFGETYGFRVTVQEPVVVDRLTVSSSQIRRLLQEGDVRLAGKMLGRFYTIEGKVIHGDGVGESLGYPTANLRLPNELIPKVGIYAARIDFLKTEGYKTQDGIVYIGTKPTFAKKAIAIEIHLLDFRENLYDKRLRVALIDRIREDQTFDSREALILQIKKDIQHARAILAATGVAPV